MPASPEHRPSGNASKAIDRITKQVLSGKIKPSQLIDDADKLFQAAGEQGREQIQPFLLEAVRRAPEGVMQTSFIDRLKKLYIEDQRHHNKEGAIQRSIKLREDLGIDIKPEEQAFINALRKKYNFPATPQTEPALSSPQATKPLLGEYLWEAKDGDIPIRVIDDLGIGPDGRRYVQIEGSLTGIPLDNLKPVHVEITESSVDTEDQIKVEVLTRYQKQADEKGVTMPEGDFICLDGQRITSWADEEGSVVPSAFDPTQTEKRLALIGSMQGNDGAVTFIGPDGKYYAGLQTTDNMRALINAGYKPGPVNNLMNADNKIADPEKQKEWERLIEKPKSVNE
ncbi:hypothetical protein HYS95_00985 [Candidatus Daviesbacteria bacterium]|nr:hypothetical protein [Candidatus Daviesbacteria bacterium]